MRKMADTDVNYIQLKFNGHLEASLNNLSFLREQQVFTDLTVGCGGQFYPVHRLVVFSCSQYFAAALQNIPKFCMCPVILLDNFSKETFEALLTFMYDGLVTVHREQLPEVLRASKLLGIKGLSQVDQENNAGPSKPDMVAVSCSGARPTGSHQSSGRETSSSMSKSPIREADKNDADFVERNQTFVVGNVTQASNENGSIASTVRARKTSVVQGGDELSSLAELVLTDDVASSIDQDRQVRETSDSDSFDVNSQSVSSEARQRLRSPEKAISSVVEVDSLQKKTPEKNLEDELKILESVDSTTHRSKFDRFKSVKRKYDKITVENAVFKKGKFSDPKLTVSIERMSESTLARALKAAKSYEKATQISASTFCDYTVDSASSHESESRTNSSKMNLRPKQIVTNKNSSQTQIINITTVPTSKSSKEAISDFSDPESVILSDVRSRKSEKIPVDASSVTCINFTNQKDASSSKTVNHSEKNNENEIDATNLETKVARENRISSEDRTREPRHYDDGQLEVVKNRSDVKHDHEVKRSTSKSSKEAISYVSRPKLVALSDARSRNSEKMSFDAASATCMDLTDDEEDAASGKIVNRSEGNAENIIDATNLETSKARESWISSEDRNKEPRSNEDVNNRSNIKHDDKDNRKDVTVSNNSDCQAEDVSFSSSTQEIDAQSSESDLDNLGFKRCGEGQHDKHLSGSRSSVTSSKLSEAKAHGQKEDALSSAENIGPASRSRQSVHRYRNESDNTFAKSYEKYCKHLSDKHLPSKSLLERFTSVGGLSTGFLPANLPASAEKLSPKKQFQNNAQHMRAELRLSGKQHVSLRAREAPKGDYRTKAKTFLSTTSPKRSVQSMVTSSKISKSCGPSDDIEILSDSRDSNTTFILGDITMVLPGNKSISISKCVQGDESTTSSSSPEKQALKKFNPTFSVSASVKKSHCSSTPAALSVRRLGPFATTVGEKRKASRSLSSDSSAILSSLTASQSLPSLIPIHDTVGGKSDVKKCYVAMPKRTHSAESVSTLSESQTSGLVSSHARVSAAISGSPTSPASKTLVSAVAGGSGVKYLKRDSTTDAEKCMIRRVQAIDSLSLQVTTKPIATVIQESSALCVRQPSRVRPEYSSAGLKSTTSVSPVSSLASVIPLPRNISSPTTTISTVFCPSGVTLVSATASRTAKGLSNSSSSSSSTEDQVRPALLPQNTTGMVDVGDSKPSDSNDSSEIQLREDVSALVDGSKCGQETSADGVYTSTVDLLATLPDPLQTAQFFTSSDFIPSILKGNEISSESKTKSAILTALKTTTSTTTNDEIEFEEPDIEIKMEPIWSEKSCEEPTSGDQKCTKIGVSAEAVETTGKSIGDETTVFETHVDVNNTVSPAHHKEEYFKIPVTNASVIKQDCAGSTKITVEVAPDTSVLDAKSSARATSDCVSSRTSTKSVTAVCSYEDVTNAASAEAIAKSAQGAPAPKCTLIVVPVQTKSLFSQNKNDVGTTPSSGTPIAPTVSTEPKPSECGAISTRTLTDVVSTVLKGSSCGKTVVLFAQETSTAGYKGFVLQKRNFLSPTSKAGKPGEISVAKPISVKRDTQTVKKTDPVIRTVVSGIPAELDMSNSGRFIGSSTKVIPQEIAEELRKYRNIKAGCKKTKLSTPGSMGKPSISSPFSVNDAALSSGGESVLGVITSSSASFSATTSVSSATTSTYSTSFTTIVQNATSYASSELGPITTAETAVTATSASTESVLQASVKGAVQGPAAGVTGRSQRKLTFKFRRASLAHSMRAAASYSTPPPGLTSCELRHCHHEE